MRMEYGTKQKYQQIKDRIKSKNAKYINIRDDMRSANENEESVGI